MKRSSFMAVLASTTALVSAAHAYAQAAPQGAQLAAGAATVKQSGAVTTINQTSSQAILNWQSFSIGQGNKVDVIQPGATSVLLNRVTGNTASTLAGQLDANGQVFLINPNGIVIGKTGVVQAAGFVASTLDISDSDFLSGNLSFKSTEAGASVVNAGTIRIAPGGYAALLGGSVDDSGNIIAPLGKVAIGAGTQATLDLSGDGFLQVALPGDTGGVTGTAIVSAATASNAVRQTVNMDGVTTATSASGEDGSVVLSGKIDTSDAAGAGGDVKVLGNTLDLAGGTITAGNADVETSGNTVDFTGVKVSASDWLVDPTDLTIDSNAAATISSNLATTDITLQTTASGASGPGNQSSGAGDIVVDSAITWSSSHALTLDAYDAITILAPITVKGAGAVNLNYGMAQTSTISPADPSLLSFGLGASGFAGSLSFTSSAQNGYLNINGAAYTLIYALGAAGSTSGTDLQGINGNLTGNYALADAIDASATSGWNGGAGFTPLGTDGAGTILNSSNGFAGSFNGLGHVITGLTINRPAADYVGLFGYVSNGTVSNLGLNSASVSGDNAVGGLAGVDLSRNFNLTVINQTFTSGSVTGAGADVSAPPVFGSIGSFVGGLVGASQATINLSYSNGTVTGADGAGGVGGLVGLNAGTLSNAYSTSAVSVGNATNEVSVGAIGGLVGENEGNISLSYATGNVVAGFDAGGVGGLVGTNRNQVTQSYATGSVSAGDDGYGVGGLVGLNIDASVDQSYATGSVSVGDTTSGGTDGGIGGLVGYNTGGVTDSYASGSVTAGLGSTEVGGLVGYNWGTVATSYSTGLVTAGAGATDVGGLVGVSSSANAVTDSYWDTQTSGQSVSSGGSGMITPLFVGLLPPGFNYSIWGDGPNLYPYLQWEYPNGVQVFTGFAYTANGAGTVAGAQLNFYKNGVQLNSGTISSGADGYYYFVVPYGTIGATTPTGITMALPGGTALSAANFTDTQTFSAYTIVTPNTTVGTFTSLTGAGSYSALQTELLNTFGSSVLTSAETALATSTQAIIASGGFTQDMTPWGTGTLAIKTLGGDLTVAAPLTFGGSSGLALDSYGSVFIDAPIVVSGTGAVFLITNDGGSGGDYGFGLGANGFAGSLSFTDAAGNGQSLTIDGNPYTLLYSMSDIACLNGSSGNFALANTLDASGTIYPGAVAGLFSGIFTGLGHVINNLAIDDSSEAGYVDYDGLFGRLMSGGVVRDLGLTNENVSNSASGVVIEAGGLAGQNGGGSISNTFATGSISEDYGSAYAGGLVGYNSGTISNSYAAVSVDGAGFIGGLDGYNSGTLSNAFYDIDKVVINGKNLVTDGGIYDSQYQDWISHGLSLNVKTYFTSDGSGVYEINDLADLKNILGFVEQPGLSFKLTSDIDLSSLPGFFIPYSALSSFDGGGHTISNLYLDQSNYYLGLFAYSLTGSISNLTITGSVTSPAGETGSLGGLAGISYGDTSHVTADVVVTGNQGSELGGLIGVNYGSLSYDGAGGAVTALGDDSDAGGLVGTDYSPSIDHSFATGDVSSSSYQHGVGGLVGTLGGTSEVVSNSYATGSVTGAHWAFAGGLIGQMGNGQTLTNDYATGAVTDQFGMTSAGGLVGAANGGAISNSYATGNVSAPNDFDGGAGGLVGSNDASITQSYATGTVTGQQFVGGLVGTDSGATIKNSYATGAIIGTASQYDYDYGGLVGGASGGTAIINSYASGNITATGDYIGGLVGSYDVTTVVSNSFYDIDKVSINGQHMVTLGGIYDNQYQDWFSNGLKLDISNYFSADSNGVYEINTLTDLKNLLGFSGTSGLSFKLTGNIDLSSLPGFFIPDFLGASFDGGGHVISNLSLNLPDGLIGFFGYADGATLSNIGIVNANVTAVNSVGILAGDTANGDVQNAYTSGNVTGTYRVGGLVGYNGIDRGYGYDGDAISRSYSSATVVGTGEGFNNGTWAGGLIGENAGATLYLDDATGSVTGIVDVGGLVGGALGNSPSGTYDGGGIINSYASGAVNGTYDVGGLVGANGLPITHSYATGNVTGGVSGAGIGGLIGSNISDSATVEVSNVYATGTVSAGDGTSYVGGLIGGNVGALNLVYATGNVSAGDSATYVGALAGSNGGTISDSYASGSVKGGANAVGFGGLVGINSGGIVNSYATGVVGGTEDVGGLVGLNSGTINAAYATGLVAGASAVGGLVGSTQGGTVTAGYYDYQTTGQASGIQGDGSTGLATAELQGALPAGFDGATWSTGLGLYPYLTPFFPNTPEAISGYGYNGDGTAASGATVDVYTSGKLLGAASTGANGYYYYLSPGAALTATTQLGGTLTLNGGSTISGAGFTDQSPLGSDFNLTAGAFTSATGAASYSALQTELSKTFGSSTLSATETILAAATQSVTASGSFTQDRAPWGTGSLALTSLAGNITVATPLTFNGGSGLTLDAYNGINILAPITVTGSGTVNLDFDTPVATALVDPTLLSFGLTSLGFSGSLNFTSVFENGALTINGAPYTLIYSLGAAGSTTGTDLQGINGNLSGNYALANNIDASPTAGWNAGAGFASLGTDGAGNILNSNSGFTGAFNGLGHTVSGLTMTGSLSFYFGLFGYASGSIGDVGVENISIVAPGSWGLGGLVGQTKSEVFDSFASGSVEGLDALGGLVGNNEGTIVNSFADVNLYGNSSPPGYRSESEGIGGLAGWNSGDIESSYAVGNVLNSGLFSGGLVGINYGQITNSYANADVSGDMYIGGLVGSNPGIVEDSYSTGYVIGNSYVGGLVGQGGGAVASSYWDTQVSGQASSGGGTGLATAQLQGTLPSGFDAAVWGTGPGLYPYLKSFFPTGAQAITGYVYTLNNAGVAAGASLDFYKNGVLLNALPVFTNVNGYYYALVPAGTVVYKTPIGTTVTLAGATGISAIGYVDTPDIVGDTVDNHNLTADRLYVVVSQPTWSDALSGMDTTFGTSLFDSLETTTAFAFKDIYGLLPTFTVDEAQDVTGVFKVSEGYANGTLIDAEPITVEPGGKVMFISAGPLDIDAPITVKGDGIADLRYDYTELTGGGTVNPADFSFGSGASLTYLTSTGAVATTSQGGSLLIENIPYTLVYSMAQLDAIDGVNGVTGASEATYGAGLGGSYALADSLNAAGTTYSQSLIGATFTGAFNGLGNDIANLTITTNYRLYAALFSYSTGLISNLTLSNLAMTGANAYVGGLVAQNQGTIARVSVSGTVTNLGGAGTNGDTGGVVGHNGGTVEDSVFSGTVSANDADTDSSVGGLVGNNAGDTSVGPASIMNSSSSGSVSGGYAVGGLVGDNNSGSNPASISQSYSTASVTGHDIIGGGLVGINYGSITDSYASGTVNGAGTSWYIGGLVGFEGEGVGSVATSYATGLVSDPGIAPGGTTAYAGGLIGAGGNAVTQSYWDTQASGQSTSADGTPLTTAELQSGSLPAGFSSSIWSATPGQYPKLKAVAGQ